jgi:hypothetical protein
MSAEIFRHVQTPNNADIKVSVILSQGWQNRIKWLWLPKYTCCHTSSNVYSSVFCTLHAHTPKRNFNWLPGLKIYNAKAPYINH